YTREVREWQAVQCERNRVQLRVELLPGAALDEPHAWGAINRQLEMYGFRGTVRVGLEVVPRLEADAKSGKFRRIVSLVGPPDDLVYPLFVYHGKNLRREIPSMPGQYQLSLDRLPEAVGEVAELGIPAVILFGIPAHKDATGSAAIDDGGIVQEAIRVARRQA